MILPALLDNRTLLACQALVATTFGIGVFAIHRREARIRGARTFSAAFLIGVPGIVLVALRGIAPNFLSIVVGNICMYVGYLLTYRSLQEYFYDRKKLPFAYAFTGVNIALHTYYSIVDPRIVPRIILIAVHIGVLRLLMAGTVLRNTERLLHRIFFGLFLVVLALVSLNRAVQTALHGAPNNYLQHNTVQTYTLVSGILFIAMEGIFAILLFSFEITNRLTRQAQQDVLTGTFGRRTIEEKLREELARGARIGTCTSVVLIDVDYLKQINDTSGHAAGDEALRRVATAVSSSLRPFDHLGRFGGDEFLLVLPEVTGSEASAIAERFRQSLAGTSSSPTLSIGIAEADPGESAPSVLVRADTALYLAKNAGRDCIRFQASDVSGVAHAATAVRL